MKFKRLLSAVLALGVALSLSVSSFAIPLPATDFSKHITIKDGNTHLDTIFSSEVPEADRPAFDALIASGQYTLFFGFPSPQHDGAIRICSTPVDTSISYRSSSDPYAYDSCDLVLPSGSQLRFVFTHEPDGFHYSGTEKVNYVIPSYLLSPAPGVTYSAVPAKYQIMNLVTGNLILDFDDPVISTHSLTINYQYADGSSAADPHTEALAKDAPYSVASPVIAGFTASPATVSGTMPDSDATITVTYTETPPVLVEHTLTIDYVYEGGGQASDSVSQVYLTGAPYLVSSPSISGYTADVKSVTGVMPDNDLTVTVTYTPISSSGGSSSGGSGGSGGGGLGDWDYGNPFLKPSSFPSFDFSNPFTKPSSLPSFSFSNPFVNPYK